VSAPASESVEVMELDERNLLAAVSIGIHECAPPVVAVVDGAFDAVGNVTLRRARAGRGCSAPRPISETKPLLLCILQQLIEGALEYLGDVTIGDLMPEECLRLAQLAVQRRAGCELNLEPLWG
jgi:hypothetical protein